MEGYPAFVAHVATWPRLMSEIDGIHLNTLKMWMPNWRTTRIGRQREELQTNISTFQERKKTFGSCVVMQSIRLRHFPQPYRVSHLLVDLGWVDFDLGAPPPFPAASAKFPFAHAELGRQ